MYAHGKAFTTKKTVSADPSCMETRPAPCNMFHKLQFDPTGSRSSTQTCSRKGIYHKQMFLQTRPAPCILYPVLKCILCNAHGKAFTTKKLSLQDPYWGSGPLIP